MLFLVLISLIFTVLARDLLPDANSDENDGPMKMIDQKWWQKFTPVQYEKQDQVDENGEVIVTKEMNYGYSKQSMKDLDEIGTLVGGGDSDLLGILRPYYSMMEMSANGNKQGIGSYLQVLPDEEEGDQPIYTLGGSFFGGLEPAGVKIGHLNRPFGKR